MAQVGELPAHFGRYRILKRLGQGGMGSVYLAEDTQLDRKVAIKVAHLNSKNDPEMIARFRREARAAAALDHPNLCSIYDSGTIDGIHYLTMALIEGESLADWLASRQSLPGREAAHIVAKLASALHEAHKKGVIHRDLKPSNVMMKRVGSNREPVIVDFGLAHRDAPNEQKLTQTGQFLGTPHYMSPEQINGEADDHGRSCDIYALGVILYELLTGQTPFDGPTPLVVVAQILMNEAPRPSSLRRDLDPSLEAVCLKAMAKHREERYATMEEFAEALDTVLASSPAQIQSRQSSSLKRNNIDKSNLSGAGPIVGKNVEFPILVVDEPKDEQDVPFKAPLSLAWLKLFAIAAPVVLLIVFLLIRMNGGNVVTDEAKKSENFVVSKPTTQSLIVAKQKTQPPVVSDKSPAKVWSSHSTGMEFVLVPAGEFDMGSEEDDVEATINEKPRHHVRITEPFFLGKFEVTRGQFRKFVEDTGYKTEAESDGKGGYGWNEEKNTLEQDPKYSWKSPGFEQNGDHPVTEVSWNDAVKFAEWLSKKDGRTYRLPTEAEWEFACRSGSTKRFSFGDDPGQLAQYGNTDGKADGFENTAPVGSFKPNAWGLYDMHGNVWEWCSDWLDASYYKTSPTDDPPGAGMASNRVDRGGSWNSAPRVCRSAFRGGGTPEYRFYFLGFRLAASMKPSSVNNAKSAEIAPKLAPA